MAANKGPAALPDELRTLKLAGMMYAKEQDEADAKALAGEAVPQPPAAIQAKTDEAVFAMLDAHAVKRKRRRRARYLLRTAAAVALIACISVPLAFTVDASRAAVANFLIQNFDQFSRITYDVENNAKAPVGWTSEYYPQWLPEGYEFSEIQCAPSRQSIWYKDKQEYQIYFSILSSDTLSSIDTEDSLMHQINVYSYHAQLFIKNNRQSSSIVIFLPSNLIYIQGALSEKDIIKIANNIHGLE